MFTPGRRSSVVGAVLVVLRTEPTSSLYVVGVAGVAGSKDGSI